PGMAEARSRGPRAWPLADRPRAGAPSTGTAVGSVLAACAAACVAVIATVMASRGHAEPDGGEGGGQSPGRQAHRPGSRQGPLPRAGGEANGFRAVAAEASPAHGSAPASGFHPSWPHRERPRDPQATPGDLPAAPRVSGVL